MGTTGAAVPGCTTDTNSFSCTNATISTITLPVTFGTVMPINLGAIIAAQPGAGVSVDPDLTLTGIQIYNADQQPISDFTITSGSGAVYGPNGIESEPANAPEPGTFLLLGLGFVGLGWVKAGRSQAQDQNLIAPDTLTCGRHRAPPWEARAPEGPLQAPPAPPSSDARSDAW